MKTRSPLNYVLVIILLSACVGLPARCADAPAAVILPPPAGKLYHGVYPGSIDGDETAVTPEALKAYETAVGAPVAWVYFSNEWGKDRAFPQKTVEWIHANGAVPFIRLMLRSTTDEDVAEPTFTLQRIIDGAFDKDITAWAKSAAAYNNPLLVEYGTECNGQWFSWNGVWNGGGKLNGPDRSGLPDGPERFVAAYRHIVDVMRAAGAVNITWVWHVNNDDDSDQPWNALENYYPGDAYVDWIAVSAYGALSQKDSPVASFRNSMDAVYPRLAAISKDKPIIVAEFASVDKNKVIGASAWGAQALEDLLTHRWPRVCGFSWWDERWEDGDTPTDVCEFRVQNLPDLAAAFRHAFTAHADALQTTPVFPPAS